MLTFRERMVEIHKDFKRNNPGAKLQQFVLSPEDIVAYENETGDDYAPGKELKLFSISVIEGGLHPYRIKPTNSWSVRGIPRRSALALGQFRYEPR